MTVPVRPGAPQEGQPFWNANALRFIYAPAFDLPDVAGATHYRFTVNDHDGQSHTFDAPTPRPALTPVWAKVAEGYTTLEVQGLDGSDKPVGEIAKKIFYRSPGFIASTQPSASDYQSAGRQGLKAIFEAPHVQTWLKNGGKPDPSYARYCYPNKVIGGLVRAMAAYARLAENERDRDAATEIGRRAADYLLSIRLAKDASPYAGVPPTYALNVRRPTAVTPPRVEKRWLLVPSVVDAAFGFLDLYDVTNDPKYLDAAKSIVEALVRTQEADGTWPLMVDHRDGKPVAPRRLIPTWPIFLFDRLEHQYKIDAYREARAKAWKWTKANPLKTYQWDAQFEDIALRGPYENMAREQACDVAVLLMSGDAKPAAEDVAQAEELLRFAEDQFVEWTPVKDVEGWKRAMPRRRKNCEAWITPCVLEQYACYDPVARSSAILINAYLRAADVTGKPIYLAKARALGDGLLAGEEWLRDAHDGNGEFPTWNMKRPPINWLNNSFYGAEAILNLGKVPPTTQPVTGSR